MAEKKAKQYPAPLGSKPTTIGKKKDIPPLTIQLDNEQMDIPFDRMLFGKISPNKTQTTAPIEEAKNATKLIREINKIHAGKPVPK